MVFISFNSNTIGVTGREQHRLNLPGHPNPSHTPFPFSLRFLAGIVFPKLKFSVLVLVYFVLWPLHGLSLLNLFIRHVVSSKVRLDLY